MSNPLPQKPQEHGVVPNNDSEEDEDSLEVSGSRPGKKDFNNDPRVLLEEWIDEATIY